MACFQQGMYGDSANNEARLPRLPQLRDSTNPLSNRFTTYPKDEIAIIFQQLTDLIHHLGTGMARVCSHQQGMARLTKPCKPGATPPTTGKFN
jgi:hypothetical protein